jgi:hypothetical protein
LLIVRFNQLETPCSFRLVGFGLLEVFLDKHEQAWMVFELLLLFLFGRLFVIRLLFLLLVRLYNDFPWIKLLFALFVLFRKTDFDLARRSSG